MGFGVICLYLTFNRKSAVSHCVYPRFLYADYCLFVSLRGILIWKLLSASVCMWDFHRGIFVCLCGYV